MNTQQPIFLQKALEWASNEYFDQQDRQELSKLIQNKNYHEIEERFYQELEFGTGGLRNIIGFGSNRINKYTIRKASQAIANILITSFTPEQRLISIGYDSRTLSDKFALEAAKVFAANNIRVKLFDAPYPVPLLSYSIKYFNACSGIMITASHNPPQYNGLKAYWSDASQLTPPIDRKVIEAYQKITSWNEIHYSDDDTSELISSCGEDILRAYTEMISSYLCQTQLIKDKGNQLKIAYTPLHGTGYKTIAHTSHYFGLTDLHVVAEQKEPDNTFPTVVVPNPEYPEALKMATDLMQEIGSDLAIGSDPDTDRLGVAYLDEQKRIHFLSGNEIGSLLLDYKLNQLKEHHQLPSNALVIKTIVTTELQSKIAQKYGVRLINTLTGFKWMGKKMRQLKKAGEDFKMIFANEESYGYLIEDAIGDKDGVSAYLLMAECALHHKQQGRNLGQALEGLYQTYGYFQESLLCLHFPGKDGKKAMNNIMEFFRSPKNQDIAGMTIAEKIDLLDHPNFPSSNVLGFTFKNGHKLWMRPSGTEPKIKFYTMFIPQSLETNKAEAQLFIENIEAELKAIAKKIL